MAQCVRAQGVAGPLPAGRDSSPPGREGFSGATQGAALPPTRVTRPLKCGSSCWSLVPSWSTGPCDSRKIPITRYGWGSRGPAPRGLAEGLGQGFAKSWQALTQDQLVCYGWVGQGLWTGISGRPPSPLHAVSH